MTDHYRLHRCSLTLTEGEEYTDDRPLPAENVGFYLEAENKDDDLLGIQLIISTRMTGFNIQRLTSDDLRKLAILFSTFADDYDINHGVEPDMMLIQPTAK